MKTIKEMLFGNKSDNLIKASKEIFQIEEFDCKFWLTYNGALICPTDMFSEEPLMALAKIRDLFIERNTSAHGTRKD